MSESKVEKEGDLVLMHDTCFLVVRFPVSNELSSNELRLLNLDTLQWHDKANGYWSSGNLVESGIKLGEVLRDIIYSNKL